MRARSSATNEIEFVEVMLFGIPKARCAVELLRCSALDRTIYGFFLCLGDAILSVRSD